jgi:hypothetical protein
MILQVDAFSKVPALAGTFILIVSNPYPNLLPEQEARHGNNAPLDLLNQISDQQQATVLTKQAIAGQLTEAEWLEALGRTEANLTRLTASLLDDKGQDRFGP